MKRALLLLSFLFAASPALAEQQGQGAASWSNSWLVQIGNTGGAIGPSNPLAALAPTLAPAAASGTTLLGSTAATILPALTTRHGWVLSNASTSGSSGYAYCTDDGSTPTPTHWTIIVYPQATTSSPPGVPVSPAIIQCAPPTGGASDINVTGEQW